MLASTRVVLAGDSPTIGEAKSTKPDASALVGRPAADVQDTLGKPMGKLQTGGGPLWLYPDWKIQFDQADRVAKVERDAPVRLPQATPDYLARVEAIERAKRQRDEENNAARIESVAATGAPRAVQVVSTGGAQVDLPSLLADGKVTIVDFYADWCGPCRAVAPELEKLARENPNVALVKIDIVNWGTPVTKQFDIKSVPSIRVFGRNKQQVGEPTHQMDLVRQYVNQGGGS